MRFMDGNQSVGALIVCVLTQKYWGSVFAFVMMYGYNDQKNNRLNDSFHLTNQSAPVDQSSGNSSQSSDDIWERLTWRIVVLSFSLMLILILTIQTAYSSLHQATDTTVSGEKPLNRATGHLLSNEVNEIDSVLPIVKGSFQNQSNEIRPVIPTATVAYATQKPKASYAFYDALSAADQMVTVRKGVYITEEEKQKAQNATFYLQAATLSKAVDADRLVAKLKAKGQPAYLKVKYSSSGKKQYPVFVGPIKSRSSLKKSQSIMAKMFLSPLVLSKASL